jgi:hypothetical protein
MKQWFLIPLLILAAGSAPAQRLIVDTVYFEFDSYLLKNEYKQRLDSLIGVFTAFPAYYIEVIGNTDNVGTEEYNLELSQERARIVALYLAEQGVDLRRITYEGKGTENPAADNETYAGRRKNRRSDLAIVYSTKSVKPEYPKDTAPVVVVPPLPPPAPVIIVDTVRVDAAYTGFSINPGHQTVILFPGKSVVVVPPGAFETDAAEVSMEVAEIFQRRDMVLVDMPTISRDGPLEVPGIISFQATVNNRPVKTVKGSTFELRVPASRRDDDMVVYSGSGGSRGGSRRPKIAEDLPPVNPVKTWNYVADTQVDYLGLDKAYTFRVPEPGTYAPGRPVYHAFNTDTKDKGIDITAKLKGKRFEKNTQIMIVGEVVRTYIPMAKKDARTYTAARVRFLDSRSRLILIAIQYDEQGNPWLIKRSFTPGEYLGKKKNKGGKNDTPTIILKAKFRKMTPERLNELLTELNA